MRRGIVASAWILVPSYETKFSLHGTMENRPGGARRIIFQFVLHGADAVLIIVLFIAAKPRIG